VSQTNLALTPDISGRKIDFVLQGNSKVKIVTISAGGTVSADGRSGQGVTDKDGLITVYLNAAAGDNDNGPLWGIGPRQDRPESGFDLTAFG
jgi:hypothetical protein